MSPDLTTVCTLATASLWDTPPPGSDTPAIVGALQALAGCRRCPLYNNGCGDGMAAADRAERIVNGIPHNPHGQPLPQCRRCGGWCLGKNGNAVYCLLCEQRVYSEAFQARRATARAARKAGQCGELAVAA